MPTTRFLPFAALSFFILSTSCGAEQETVTVEKLKEQMAKIAPLHTRPGKPQQGDWLASFSEAGQTFDEYINCTPVKATAKRNKLCIQPIGDFDKNQKKVLDLAAEFLGLYYDLPVEFKDPMSLDVVPLGASRTRNPQKGDLQLLTTYIIEEVLYPKRPKDAAAYLGFTTTDLWPGEGWNFVFGQALLDGRVGVWSINRFGDPAKSDASFKLCLLRTMKLATHETGHMFTMEHCTAYMCNMAGTNSLDETDKHPLWLCPECMAKVCWMRQVDPVSRYTKLADFCKEQGFPTEQTFYEKSIEALKK
jgi:archaemetzincin